MAYTPSIAFASSLFSVFACYTILYVCYHLLVMFCLCALLFVVYTDSCIILYYVILYYASLSLSLYVSLSLSLYIYIYI